MIENEKIKFIQGTSVSVSVYSVERYEPHYHNECIELLFVLKGEIDILSSYDRFHLKKGDFTVINRDDVHYISDSGDNLTVSIHINLADFQEKYEYIRYIYFICESFNANSMQEKYNPQIRNMVTDIIIEAAKGRKDTDRINELTDRLMDVLISKYDFVYYHNGREIPDNQLQRYYRIMKEIETRYGEKLDLEELAQKEFIGKNYVSQFWKKLTNMNFTDYLTSVRSEKAEKMLLTSNKSINEISLKCGFSDPKYIYRGFKKWYEKTPSAHKKEYEAYKAAGTKITKYSESETIKRFGRELMYADIGEEKAYLINSASMETSTGQSEGWRKKYETQMSKYSGSKLKKEMIRESQIESGLREIHLPLFDKAVIGIDRGIIDMDEEFISETLRRAKEMSHILYIEMFFSDRTADEWERIIRFFTRTVKESSEPDLMQRCRFIIYFDEFEEDVEVKELIDRVVDDVGRKNIKMALKFH